MSKLSLSIEPRLVISASHWKMYDDNAQATLKAIIEAAGEEERNTTRVAFTYSGADITVCLRDANDKFYMVDDNGPTRGRILHKDELVGKERIATKTVHLERSLMMNALP